MNSVKKKKKKSEENGPNSSYSQYWFQSANWNQSVKWVYFHVMLACYHLCVIIWLVCRSVFFAWSTFQSLCTDSKCSCIWKLSRTVSYYTQLWMCICCSAHTVLCWWSSTPARVLWIRKECVELEHLGSIYQINTELNLDEKCFFCPWKFQVFQVFSCSTQAGNKQIISHIICKPLTISSKAF